MENLLLKCPVCKKTLNQSHQISTIYYCSCCDISYDVHKDELQDTNFIERSTINIKKKSQETVGTICIKIQDIIKFLESAEGTLILEMYQGKVPPRTITNMAFSAEVQTVIILKNLIYLLSVKKT